FLLLGGPKRLAGFLFCSSWGRRLRSSCCSRAAWRAFSSLFIAFWKFLLNSESLAGSLGVAAEGLASRGMTDVERNFLRSSVVTEKFGEAAWLATARRLSKPTAIGFRYLRIRIYSTWMRFDYLSFDRHCMVFSSAFCTED